MNDAQLFIGCFAFGLLVLGVGYGIGFAAGFLAGARAGGGSDDLR